MAPILGAEELLLLLAGASLPQSPPQSIVLHSTFSPAWPLEAFEHGIPSVLETRGDGELNYQRGRRLHGLKRKEMADLRKELHRGAWKGQSDKGCHLHAISTQCPRGSQTLRENSAGMSGASGGGAVVKVQ